MIFNLDYSNFLSLNDCPADQFEIVKNDFTSNLVDLLRDMGCDSYITDSVAHSLFWSMISDKTYYHTPVHILYILAFVQEHNIELKNWEKLTIFFHDAIYRPGSGKNEQNSAEFMQSLLKDTGIDELELAYAHIGIQTTSNHLSDKIESPESYSLIMDLDLVGFAANPKPFNLQNRLIEKEFCQPSKKGYGCTLELFLQGRIKFLLAMKQRKSLYRTTLFVNDLNMEVKAQINLDNQVKETQRRIDNLIKKSNPV